jgi:hypothetical protein
LVIGGSTGVILLLVILAVGFHSAIDRQLHSWKLLPEPGQLTELYFTHPNSLPKTYVPGQMQTVSFTVHNLEYQTTDYTYKIVEVSGDNSQVQTLTTGSFTLTQNIYKQETVNISTIDLGEKVKVEVDLVKQNETIDYLLNRSGA